MKQFIIALFLTLALGCAKSAPGATAEPNPALWRVSDADSEIYLFGGVHVLPPDLRWRSPAIDAAFASSDTIYFEAPTDAAASVALAALVQRLGFNPPGVTLSSLLTESERAAVTRMAQGAGVPPDSLAPLRPWFAAIRLSLAHVISEGHDPEAGVERVLEAEARASGKSVRYLETLEQQLSFFANLSPEAEKRFLLATVRQYEEELGQIDELDSAWARGDVERLEDLLIESISEAGPEAYDAILARRNAAWTEEIVRLLEGEGRIFISVGAAHLVGEDSVVALLRARGIAVQGPD